MIKIFSNLRHLFTYFILKKTNAEVKRQIKNNKLIPIIIINYNQLKNLKILINFLIDRNFKNIVIIDNCSTYNPLLDYYNEIKNIVTLELLKENKGHRVFFNSPDLLRKYAKGFYILTDPDILPNSELPENFLEIFIIHLEKKFNKISKVGFALNISNIPDFYPIKKKVVEWEKKYWEIEVQTNVYSADIDTTFALYKPQYPLRFKNVNFYKALRFAGDFTSEHMGWFINPINYSDEESFYFNNAKNSSSWRLNDKGQLTGYKKKY